MSVAPFASRLTAKLTAVSERLAEEKPPREGMSTQIDMIETFKRIVAEEASSWDASRSNGAGKGGKLTEHQVRGFFGSLVAGAVQMGDVATVRSALRWYVENEELWNQLKTIESTQVEAH